MMDFNSNIFIAMVLLAETLNRPAVFSTRNHIARRVRQRRPESIWNFSLEIKIIEGALFKCKKETKSFSPLFRMDFMMDIVCVHNSFHVRAFSFEFGFYSSMNDDIVKN